MTSQDQPCIHIQERVRNLRKKKNPFISINLTLLYNSLLTTLTHILTLHTTSIHIYSGGKIDAIRKNKYEK